ncbi:MAG: hypothetical protein QM802_17490 [Agriterribacter sp.]
MKISIPGLFLRAMIIAIVIFSVYRLLIQFIFSYLNQNTKGPELTVLNFAGPLLLTIFILVLAVIQVLFKKIEISKISSNAVLIIVLVMLLSALMAWQIWYVVTLYKMKSGSDFNGKFTDLMPMITGLLATLFFIMSALRRTHAS